MSPFVANRCYVELRGSDDQTLASKQCETAADGVAWLIAGVDKTAGRTGRFVGRLTDTQMLLFLSRFGIVPEPE